MTFLVCLFRLLIKHNFIRVVILVLIMYKCKFMNLFIHWKHFVFYFQWIQNSVTRLDKKLLNSLTITGQYLQLLTQLYFWTFTTLIMMTINLNDDCNMWLSEPINGTDLFKVTFDLNNVWLFLLTCFYFYQSILNNIILTKFQIWTI